MRPVICKVNAESGCFRYEEVVLILMSRVLSNSFFENPEMDG